MSAAPSVTADLQAELHAFLARWFEHCPAKNLIEVRPLNPRNGPPLKQSWHSRVVDAERAALQCVEHGDDVYVGALPRTHRSGKQDACGARLWLWADIDYGTEGHAKPAIHATREDALQALNTLQIPTILVDTGGGLHAWWALRGNERTDAEWKSALRRVAHAVGGDVNVTDTARILRVPGTFNLKLQDRPRPARLLQCNADLYRIEDFDGLADSPAAEPIPFLPRPGASISGDRPFDRANDVPIADALEWLGVQMHREGSAVKCACPVHHGTNASQMVVGGGEYNTAHCFGDCGRSWTVVDVVGAALGLEPREAVNALAERFGFDGFPPERPAPQRAVAQPPANDPTDWRALLSVTSKCKLRAEPSNVALILSHDERWQGVLAHNEMTKSPVLLQAAPWTPECQPGSRTGPMSDSDVTRVRIWLTRNYNLDVSSATAMEGVDIAGRGAAYHPVRQYLDGLRWDGVKRIERIAPDILGADNALAPTMMRKFFVSAVARVMQPGCKVDTSLILVGPQGWRKSSFFAAISGEWFVDSAIVLGDKDAYLQIHTAWIYEVAEIDSLMRSRDAEAVKAFASSATDTFRAPYARSAQQHPRSCVIVGTTNQDRFLTDDTGSRRWWCVQVQRPIDTVALTAQRDQLWAEAVAAYRAGETWWLSPEEERQRAVESSERDTIVDDPWYDAVVDAVSTLDAVSTRDILTRWLCVPAERHTDRAAKRVASIMRHAGWRPGKAGRGKVRVWRKGAA